MDIDPIIAVNHPILMEFMKMAWGVLVVPKLEGIRVQLALPQGPVHQVVPFRHLGPVGFMMELGKDP